jgi:hypothetical protein
MIHFQTLQQLHLAHHHYYMHQFSDALEVALNIFNQRKTYEIIQLICRCYLKLQDYKTALEFWNQHSEVVRSSDPNYYFFTGHLYHFNNNLNLSLIAFVEYLKLRKDDYKIWQYICNSFVNASTDAQFCKYHKHLKIFALHSGALAVYLFNRLELLNEFANKSKAIENQFYLKVENLQKELGFQDYDFKNLPNFDPSALEAIGLSHVVIEFMTERLTTSSSEP